MLYQSYKMQNFFFRTNDKNSIICNDWVIDNLAQQYEKRWHFISAIFDVVILVSYSNIIEQFFFFRYFFYSASFHQCLYIAKKKQIFVLKNENLFLKFWNINFVVRELMTQKSQIEQISNKSQRFIAKLNDLTKKKHLKNLRLLFYLNNVISKQWRLRHEISNVIEQFDKLIAILKLNTRRKKNLVACQLFK